MSVYNASKAAIRSFARTWTADLKDRHIRVNVISPGTIDTGVFTGVPKEVKDQFVSIIPMGASASRARSQRPHSSWPPGIPVSSLASSCLSMAEQRRYSREGLLRNGGSGGIRLPHTRTTSDQSMASLDAARA